MASFPVACITKRGDHYNAHERITHIGIDTTQGRQQYTSEQVISWIEKHTHSFSVSRGGRTSDVIVATHNGRKYLKTTADGYSPDNLLALPEC